MIGLRSTPRWYEESWAMLCACLLVLPLGVFLVARHPRLGWRLKVLGAGGPALAVCLMGVLEYRTGLLDRLSCECRVAMARFRAAQEGQADRRPEELSTLLTALTHAPVTPDLRVQAAGAAESGGHRRLARSLLASVALAPGRDPDAVISLVRLEQKDPSTARHAERLLEEAIGDGLLYQGRADVLVALAGPKLAAGDLATAEAYLRRVVLLFRRDYYDEVYGLLARIEERRGDLERAVRMSVEALRADPGDAGCRALLALVDRARLDPVPFRALAAALRLHTTLGAHEQGRDLMEKILARHPGFAGAEGCHYSLATHFFYFQREYAAALRHYEAVIRAPGGECYLRALYQRAQTLENLGRDAEAVAQYRQLVDEAPHGATLAAMARLQLARLRRLGRLPGGSFWLSSRPCRSRGRA